MKFTESDIARFNSKIHPDPNTGCFIWTGNTYVNGYGRLSITRNGKTRSFRAHRMSYSLHKGDLIDGLDICHKCDNRLCVNPEHLWQGTRHENLLDCKAKGRNPQWTKTHCKAGHELSQENTFIRGNDGFRECRLCKTRRKREQYHKLKHTLEFRMKNAARARKYRERKANSISRNSV